MVDLKLILMVNEEEKPSDESMFYKRYSEGLSWGDFIFGKWNENTKKIDFADNEHEKILDYVMTHNLSENQNLSHCIEIKDSLAYFNEPNKLDDEQREILLSLIEGFVLNKKYEDEKNIKYILENFHITRKTK
jgi:hypothetical protein